MRKFCTYISFVILFSLLSLQVSSQTITHTDETVANLPLPNQPVTALQSLIIFPNPVISSATFRLTCKELGRSVINIYDNSGKLVRKMAFEKTQFTYQQVLNLSNLLNGIYTVEVITALTLRLRIKVVKQ